MKLRKVLALVLVAVIMASCTACTTIELVIPVAGVPAGNVSTDTQTPPAQQTPPVQQTPSQEQTTAAQQTPSQETTTAAQQTPEQTTAAPAEQTTAAPAPSGAPQGTAAIVEYYNTAVNKIKASAKTVTRNFEDNQHNEDKLVVPSALQSIGSNLIGTFLKPNNTPETYEGADAIKAKFPIPGESYSSKLTADAVQSAECKDNGSEYEITIVAKTEKNPTYGKGVSGGFEIIGTDAVMDAAGFIVKSFETEYYNCTVKCKVDKATGNITWINFSTPVVMSVSTKIGIDAQVGMTFVKDYTVKF